MMMSNARGWKVNEENDQLPLKLFVECAQCGGPITGYLNKVKNIHYYKCRTKGCSTSKNAKQLTAIFLDELGRVSINEDYFEIVVKEITASVYNAGADVLEEEKAMSRRVFEIDQKLKR